MHIRKNRFIQSVILVFSILFSAASGHARPCAIGFLVGDSDAWSCAQAFKNLDIPQVELAVFTPEDIRHPEIRDFVKRMDLAVVDIMQRQPAEWLLANRFDVKPGTKMYAVRTSSHTRDYLDAGFIMDSTVRRYFKLTSSENLKNLVLFLSHRDLHKETRFESPFVPPENALYHPDAPKLFAGLDEYVNWYRKTGHYQNGRLWNLNIAFPSSVVEAHRAPLDALIRALENEGIHTVTWLQTLKNCDKTLDRLISSTHLKGRLGSVTGLGLKFSAMLSSNLIEVLKKADVPVFNPQIIFFSTGKEWLASSGGISPMGIAFQFCVPELSGLIEPSVIGFKERVETDSRNINAYQYEPMPPLLDKLARRVARWHRLKQMPDTDKKIVLMYCNHGAGKQNIGASYLNVFRSIQQILDRIQPEGCRVDGGITEEQIKDLLIKSGRNIGAWAPDELDQLVHDGNVVTVSMEAYRQWLSETDPVFQARLEKDWGRPEDSTIMIKDGRFIIPCISLGNLILVPQPSRGWSDDPEKLYHSTTLYPHHQYVAFYLWLQKKFNPDVMISLGTHGTHEWLPGKQAGLSYFCPPEVLIGDISNLYPYIVDDVGEGIQAKRRGRGVIIDHAVPPLKKGGLYEEYSKLAALISEHEASPSELVREARFERIRKMVAELGLDKELSIAAVDEESIEKVEHYLIELKTEMIPYGLHTFGVSPAGEGLSETAAAIAAQGKKSKEYYETRVKACGPSEIESLMRGLRGGYIPPASGNDPIRNPESLHTGKNFYAFDPEKVPSKEAWVNGKKAAEELIDHYMQQHDGKFPEQIGVILWATETIRDEGIGAATALSLLGMQPVWDHRDKISGMTPIPGDILKRPRIDVLLQMSGLFRDTFPSVALKLDGAVKQAAVLDDVKNFVRNHTTQLYDLRIFIGRMGNPHERDISGKFEKSGCRRQNHVIQPVRHHGQR